ncbi:MAG: ketoacyl-ACP synthase III [Bacteroidetes bacterium]|nr:ketoacyl-ACP synthase III [Bacteroidota bacterium]
MYINSIGHYLPEQVIPNSYFQEQYGFHDKDIVEKSGIRERRKAQVSENTNTMALDATEAALENLPYPIEEVNLIIGATYSPYDTVGTVAHTIQEKYKIAPAICLSLTAACSSYCNALEIVQCFFATGKATKALVVASEHNTRYCNENDPASGFLWGDGASAVFLSAEKIHEQDAKILDIKTNGLGHVGKSIRGVFLRPKDGGIRMPFGRDVFQQACIHMQKEAEKILESNQFTVNDLTYLIPHQANLRIIDYIRKSMKLTKRQVVVNLDKLGNTGCASSAIGLSQIYDQLKEDDIAVITVFGGGYSSGAVLIRKC